MLKPQKFAEAKNPADKRPLAYAFEVICSLPKRFAGSHLSPNKRSGMSLLIAMLGSSIALGVVSAIMVSLSLTLEQAQSIERSTQVFFAVESGLEAGFFHHNSRGQGVEFPDLDSVNSFQEIDHDNVSLTTQWTIDGRADGNTIDAASLGFTPYITEGRPLAFTWSWDTAVSADQPKSISSADHSEFSLTLTSPVPGFDFGQDILAEEPVINWMITRKYVGRGIQSISSWTPEPSDPCTDLSGGGGYLTSFVCRDDFLPSLTLAHDDNIRGRLTPRIDAATEMIVDDFTFLDADASDFRLIITPLAPFTSFDGATTIPGIEYSMTSDRALPLPFYRVETRVQALGFNKKIILDKIPEQTGISAFNYVIFD